MTTHLDGLREDRDISQAAWLFFILAYKAETLDIYMFVEGKTDLSYYLPIVRQYWRRRGDVNGFECKGKDNLIALIPRVKERLEREGKRTIFCR